MTGKIHTTMTAVIYLYKICMSGSVCMHVLIAQCHPMHSCHFFLIRKIYISDVDDTSCIELLLFTPAGRYLIIFYCHL